MAGYGFAPPSVKCEPPPDHELHYYNIQVPSNVEQMCPIIKHELDPGSDDALLESPFLQHLQGSGLEALAPAAPAAVPVRAPPPPPAARATLETLEPKPHCPSPAPGAGEGAGEGAEDDEFAPLRALKDEPDDTELCADGPEGEARRSPKAWRARDMERALDALRSQQMSLTKASTTYGIPSTTLWQRAHRLGIDTPKKEGGSRAWGEGELRAALAALRAGAISANKASKAYGIPSSTLYKIARREGIRLAAPFNAAPTAWRRADLARALAAIRAGQASVQRASAIYGIPTGTLYGRCKREGIELSRASPAPWSERAMRDALDAVRVGQMSINQAAIHYNLPYSSLYGRFKRCKLPQSVQHMHPQEPAGFPEMEPYHYAQPQGEPVYPPPDDAAPDPALFHHELPAAAAAAAACSDSVYYTQHGILTS
ncbi:hypothetical protein JYU34_021573 [Plutella xylostella]|uniref:HTH psq-type domain-containing protein n=1 Tax=Plutella xylostella TaxID=51655 RepID=A0ABQ7PVF8_PLUXY|nr:hypothetical protein JYU34_021573 [Plutella xylostella]